MGRLFYTLLLALLLMAVTCERPVEISFPQRGPELVLISTFSPDRALEAQVSLSRDLNAPLGAEYLTNANIKLLEGKQFLQQLSLVRPPAAPPYYTSINFEPQLGATYTLQVDVTGYDRLLASTTLPNPTEIRNLSLSQLRTTSISDSIKLYTFQLNLTFDDPPGEKNYYHLKIFQQLERFSVLNNDTIISEISTRELLFPSQQNNNFQVAHYDGGLLFEDLPFDGENKTINLPLSVQVLTNEELPGKILAELRTVSEAYYLFFSSVSRQRLAPTSPVAEPIIIFNHVENGNGVFASFSRRVDSVAIQNQ